MTRSPARIALVVIDAFVGLTAAGGGLALVFGLEKARFPVEWLRGSPFSGYTVPGLILAAVVGGSAVIAALTTIRSQRAGGPASMVAGSIMMGWIIGEILLLKQPTSRPTATEAFYFLAGFLMTGLGYVVARAGGVSFRGLIDVGRIWRSRRMA